MITLPCICIDEAILSIRFQVSQVKLLLHLAVLEFESVKALSAESLLQSITEGTFREHVKL